MIIQSISDIITNSSSEIFCQIESSNEIIIEEIKSYLEQIFQNDKNIEITNYDNNYYIDFWKELDGGENEYISEYFAALIKYVLLLEFDKNDFKINTDVPL